MLKCMKNSKRNVLVLTISSLSLLSIVTGCESPNESLVPTTAPTVLNTSESVVVASGASCCITPGGAAAKSRIVQGVNGLRFQSCNCGKGPRWEPAF